jgi:hypothetical protein
MIPDTMHRHFMLGDALTISDVDGPDVAKWGYEELLVSDAAAADWGSYALDSAVIKLRDAGLSPDHILDHKRATVRGTKAMCNILYWRVGW